MGAIRRKEQRVSSTSAGESVLGASVLRESRAAIGGRQASAPRSERRPALVSAPPAASASTFTARLVAVDDAGQAWISWEGEPEGRGSAASQTAPSTAPSSALPARSTVALASSQVGREVLVCLAGNSVRPIIIGVLTEAGDGGRVGEPNIDLVVERRRIVLAASTEVVLRCGEGSITLGADGKVTIRGLDVVSSATRTQRIRGGAVRIN